MNKLIYTVFVSVFALTFAKAEEIYEDRRPIILMDVKDVHDNTQEPAGSYRMQPAALMEKVKVALTKSELYNIVDIRDIGHNMEKKRLFDVLQGASKELTIKAPAYRMSVDINKFKEWRYLFPHAQYIDWVAVELVIKMVDMKTSETVFSKKYVEDSNSGTMTAPNGVPPDLTEARRWTLDRLVDKQVSNFSADFAAEQRFPVLSCTPDGKIAVAAPSSLVKAGDRLTLSAQVGSSKSRRSRDVAVLIVRQVSAEECVAEFLEVLDTSAKWSKVFVRLSDRRKVD